MKKILITGGAGFIGSHLIKYLIKKYSDILIVNLDLLTYAGNLENLKSIENDDRYRFIKGDIKDYDIVNSIFEEFDIQVVINLAAESHVDRSITNPFVFTNTNIIGTQTLLEVSKKHWKINIEDKYCKSFKAGVKFIQVSTDEVYGSLGGDGKFDENHLISPNSPYSASKASADLFVRAYYETYGLPINITRCSNNYGPNQFPEKLIPLLITNCLNNKELPIYGDGLQVRDWIHVNDHCAAIDTVMNCGEIGEIYNIGGDNEQTNIAVVKKIIETLKKSENLIKFINDRPGHDKRYAIDHSKITNKLGWKPKISFNDGIKETVNWYLKNDIWIENVINGEYVEYYEKMYLSTFDKGEL